MLEDIRLTPDEVKATHPYWNGLSDDAVKRVKVATDTATDKAIKKMVKLVEIALLVHPDYRNAWFKEYLEPLKKLVGEK